MAPLAPEVRAEVGLPSVETAMVEPFVPASPPPSHHRGIAALKGAGGSLLAGVGAGLESGGVAGLIVGTAFGVVAAPFVALGAAVVAPPTSDVQHSASSIRIAIERVPWDAALKEAVEKESPKPASAVAEQPSAQASRLKLTIEGPWLIVDGGDAIPTLTVHGELMQEGACLADRFWRWNGDSDDFVDLGDDGAKDYRTQMTGGLTLLAKAVVADLLVSGEPRLTTYDNEAAAQRGGLPLVVTDPMNYQEQVGSWDKIASEAAVEPPCSGFLAVEPPNPTQSPSPPQPPTDTCSGFGCRNV